MADREPPWSAQIVEGVANVLGDSATGLRGGEIGDLLAELHIPDPGAGLTKRYRLRDALLQRQARDNSAGRIVTFIVRAMAPVRYITDPGLRTLRQDALNEVLIFQGLRLREDGTLGRGVQASTLSDAAKHANSLRAELRRRGTHPDVLHYCTREILAKDSFHAMLEASKSVFDKLRQQTGLTTDGATIISSALDLGKSGQPLLAINNLATQSERDEQTGFSNVLKGFAGMFRNPTAHDPRINRPVSDDELLECLTSLSMIHRRLDAARRL